MVALEEEMKATGAWLFSGRLTEPDMATVVRASAGDALTTDGPFVESKEHLAGFYIVEADDLDAALGWASEDRPPSSACRSRSGRSGTPVLTGRGTGPWTREP